MLTDPEGKFVTAGQWHDEKFYTFTASPEDQAAAPSHLLLGGMQEEADLPQAAVAEKSNGVEAKTVEVY